MSHNQAQHEFNINLQNGDYSLGKLRQLTPEQLFPRLNNVRETEAAKKLAKEMQKNQLKQAVEQVAETFHRFVGLTLEKFIELYADDTDYIFQVIGPDLRTYLTPEEPCVYWKVTKRLLSDKDLNSKLSLNNFLIIGLNINDQGVPISFYVYFSSKMSETKIESDDATITSLVNALDELATSK